MADNPSNIVPDNLIVVEGGKQLVPAPAPSDAGKVLGVVNSSGGIGWVEDQGGTLTQVQADWAESDPSKVSYIDNKPTIPSKTSDLQNDSGFITSSDIPAIPTKTSELQNDSGFITSASVPTKTSELQNDSGFITSSDIPAQVQANWNESNSSSAAYIRNKPSIPSKTSDLQNDSGFITSSDIPLIPTKTSDLQNDSGFITSSDIPAQVQANWNETNTSSAAYIQNKPTIPPGVIVDQTYNASSTNAQSGVAVAEAIAAIPAAPTYSEGDGIDITNNVISADVDGTTIGIDSTTHKIKSLQTIPTKTSDLQNDSGFITSSDIPTQVQANWNESNSSSAAYIQNKPTIPAVDQTYSASSTNAQSGVAVASAVAGVNAVPASTSADEDKVLTVNSSGTPVWATSAVPASTPLVQGSGITITPSQNDVTISANVDQTYNSSSTNAQSGVAVASAIAGVNQVPASTSADEDKVLTVNSSGTPVWAAAQGGGGGSGADSEFPYDPGYMHTGWNKMVVRFGDTTYDPTNKTSASAFTSIVALNEPGVYEYTFNLSTSHGSRLFQYEWNDITNNPVDVLQLTSDNQLIGGYYTALFAGCSGLRSVWNFRGHFGAALGWFRECPNLEIVSGKIPERLDALSSDPSNISFSGVCVKLTYNAAYMFYNCIKLKKAELVLGFTSSASTNGLLSCFEGDIKLQVGAAIIGFVADASYAYKGCYDMARLYGESDEPRLLRYFWSEYNPKVAGLESSLNTNIEQMFSSCWSFSDFNGVTLRYGKVSNMSYAFSGCHSLKRIPSFNIATTNGGNITVYADYAFGGCSSLEQLPDIPYNRIRSASFLCSGCINLTDVTPLLSIATTSIENVAGICESTYLVSRGALELYNALSTTSVGITSYDYAFSDCGECGWNDVRSQIPSAWGGMGA